MAGSGAHPARILLVRWAKGSWDAGFETAPDMDDDLRAAITAFADDGRRVNLIDRKSEPRDRHQLYLFPEAVTISVARADMAAALRAAFGGDIDGWEDAANPLILVCTHGKRDRCCAARGFSLYRALRDTPSARAQIWESTHLGGCRFAGGALVLPQMHKYGRLAAECAKDLLDASQDGRILLDHWRGPCDLEAEAQAAVVAAVGHLGGEVDSSAQLSDGSWQVTYGGRVLTVQTYLKTTERPGNCAALDAGECVSSVGYKAIILNDSA